MLLVSLLKNIHLTKLTNQTTVKDCNFCKKTKKVGEKAFSSCARCRAVRYCSSECQQKDWGTHKDACAPREKSKTHLNPAQKECQVYTIEAQRCKRAGDRIGESKACNSLGNAYKKLGHFHKAIKFYTKVLNISRELGDRAGEGVAYGNLGSMFEYLGQFDEEFHTKHFNICRELGDRAGEGSVYCNLGIPYGRLGQYDKAIEYFTKHLNICRELGDRAGEGSAYCNLGNAFDLLGRYNKSIEFTTKGLNIVRALGDRAVEGRALGNLGIAFFRLGQINATRRSSFKPRNAIFAVSWETGLGKAGRMTTWLVVFDFLGQRDKAVEFYTKSLNICRELGDTVGEEHAKKGLGLIN